MPISDAKHAANRRNALLSTGPKSSEGRSICRKNALKHGMTGEGVALPQEDQDEITRRFVAMQAEMQPRTDAGCQLIRRFAMLSVRLRRCEQQETGMTARRVRHAISRFDDERLAAVEAPGQNLYREPATTSRRLQMTPEGIDWLLDEWENLRGELTLDDPVRWTQNHRMHFDCLLGRTPGGYRVGRTTALSEAMGGFFHHLDPADGEGLEEAERSAWAKSELVRLIDVEKERLERLRIDLDTEAIAEDRAEAVDRALFDCSPESTLERKYEAATERAMYRALKEFRQVEADAAAGVESEITPDTVRQSEPVGLNLPEVEDDEPEAGPDAATPPRSAENDASAPTLLNLSIGRAPEMGLKPAKPIDHV